MEGRGICKQSKQSKEAGRLKQYNFRSDTYGSDEDDDTANEEQTKD